MKSQQIVSVVKPVPSDDLQGYFTECTLTMEMQTDHQRVLSFISFFLLLLLADFWLCLSFFVVWFDNRERMYEITSKFLILFWKMYSYYLKFTYLIFKFYFGEGQSGERKDLEAY